MPPESWAQKSGNVTFPHPAVTVPPRVPVGGRDPIFWWVGLHVPIRRRENRPTVVQPPPDCDPVGKSGGHTVGTGNVVHTVGQPQRFNVCDLTSSR